jgi:hypothetical protein
MYNFCLLVVTLVLGIWYNCADTYAGGLEQVMQDEMLSEAANGTDFMAGLEDLIPRDDAQMSVIW